MAILSAVQFCPTLARSMAEVANNYRRCEPLIHRAIQLGSQFIAFPELAFTGYSFQSRDEAALVCEAPNGPTFRFMQGVAQEAQAYVSWGYVETDGANLYNSATLVDPKGKVLTTYRKINQFSSDFLWCTPGVESAPVVETEFGSTSIVVCRDLRDKIPLNIPRVASKNVPLFGTQKLDLVAASVNWGKGGYPANSWMDFVANHRCTLIIANRWGKEEGSFGYKQDFGQGGSIIIEPSWKCHTGGIAFGQDCVVTAATE
jgi:predicted amidohydrolase